MVATPMNLNLDSLRFLFGAIIGVIVWMGLLHLITAIWQNKLVTGRIAITEKISTFRVRGPAATLIIGRHCYYIGFAPDKEKTDV